MVGCWLGLTATNLARFGGGRKPKIRKITINPFAFSVVVVSKTRPQSKTPFPNNLCNPNISHVVERSLTNPINK